MAGYSYDLNDGKLHTRYSELATCTAGEGVKRAVLLHFDMLPRVETEYMAFGTERHEMWAEEAEKTGKTAACFGVQYEATHIEREFAANVLPDVIMHMRPDVVSVPEKAIIDYKTLYAESFELGKIRAETTYSKSKQLAVYAYILLIFGIRIKKQIFLVEIWNKEQTEILGTHMVERTVSLLEIKSALDWIRSRAMLLSAAIEDYLSKEA